MGNLYKLTCSQCGRRFRGAVKGEVLSRLAKHQRKVHKEWLSRRVKSGMRKAKKARQPLPNFPQWIGFAERPLIEKVTGRPYEEVRQAVLDWLVSALLGGIQTPKA